MRYWLIKIRGELTQEEASKLVGISRSAYSNIETGKRNPSVTLAKKIAKTFGFDWQLFFEDERFVTKRLRATSKEVS